MLLSSIKKEWELCSFGYTPLSVSLRLSPLSQCVCVKYYSILKRMNESGPTWKHIVKETVHWAPMFIVRKITKRLQAFSSASCILQPSIQSPNTRFFHQLDENLALWLKEYSGLHIVWAKEIFLRQILWETLCAPSTICLHLDYHSP